MKGFVRKDTLFSLCGLNCGLCSMHLGGHCPGCGEGSQSCKLARCSLDRGGLEYCYQCEEYPCEKYEKIDDFDSFITHKHRKRDMEKAKKLGPEAYGAEQREKIRLLEALLGAYNDGRKKTLYCLAVNLLEVDEIKQVLQTVEGEALPPEKRPGRMAEELKKLAAAKGIELKLRRKKETARETQ